MGSCNTTQNERSGKDLLLKICEDIEDVDVLIGTDDDPEAILKTDHGLVVGDMVRFDAVDLGTLDDVNADQLYFVVSAEDNSFKIAVSPGGTPITFTEAWSDIDLEAFKTIGGLRTSSFAFASEAIEISNYGSNQWRQIKDGAGFRTVSVSGDGVYTSAANFRALEADAFANNLVCLGFVDVTAGRVYHGCYKIVSVEASSEFSGEATFTLSAESADETKIYQAV